VSAARDRRAALAPGAGPARPLWRAAACAALLAFACLPHGHLRGHEEVAAARAFAAAPTHAIHAVPAGPEAPARHAACPLCLSLAKLRDALPEGAGVELPVLAATTAAEPPRGALVPEAPLAAHASPRAPPAA
jgi:hypothetical protein